MPDWSLFDSSRAGAAGAVSASSVGTTVTSSASTNTKGSWTQLIASTAWDAQAIWVQPRAIQSSVEQLIDIGVGGSGSEVVLVPNLYDGTRGGGLSLGVGYFLPISIPAGTRIAARNQATTGSSVAKVTIALFQSGFMVPQGLSRVTAYGANTGASGGTSVDPGGTANTKGAWSQLTASTTNAISALILAIGNQLDSARATATWLVDIGIGAAGSEVVLVPDIQLNVTGTASTVVPVQTPLLPVGVAAGTRLAVRAQCSINTATHRLFDAIIYGVD